MKGREKYKVGIIGLRHLHPKAYLPLFANSGLANVVGAMEADAGVRETFRNATGVPAYSNLEELLDNAQPDVAAIFLPHNECAAAAEACAERGIHLMVEKPVAESAAAVDRIIHAARKHRVKFTTGYCWRYHPAAQRIKQLVDAGALGKLVSAEGRCAAGRLQRYIDGNSEWILEKARSGGGPIYNLGVHWIDLFRYILGSEVRSVSGRNTKVNVEYDIEDHTHATLEYDNGVLLALDISYLVPDSFPHGRDLYVALRGTRGVISWAPAYEGAEDEIFVCSDAPGFEGAPNQTIRMQLAPTPGYSGFMGQKYVTEFLMNLENDSAPFITGEDALAALQVVEGVYASAEKGSWIRL